MRYYEIYEPHYDYPDILRVIIVSEEQIRCSYYPFWIRQGLRYQEANPNNEYTMDFESCLDSWIITNWAVFIGNF